MTPAQIALTMTALGGSRAIAPTSALPADAGTVAPAPMSRGLGASVLHPPMSAPRQAAATPWSAIVAELGIGRADLGAEAAHPFAASEPDEHGWGAIAAELNANPPSRSSSNLRGTAQPNGSHDSAGAAGWDDVVAVVNAEAGVTPGAHRPSIPHTTDPGWSDLVAEAATERQANTQG